MVMRIQGRKLERVSKTPVVNYLLGIIKIFLSTLWIILICFDKMKIMNMYLIVYKVNIRGQEVIFYILLEFQSTVDYRMPTRLLFYIVEIWREILKNDRRRKDFRLPAVVPMVLYNGKNRWTAYRNFKDVLSGGELFGENTIDFRYILFDIYRYDESQL
ncbi:hypothetical protein CLOSBL3_20521 [Clostridiaceae bacterium BL-3]|nr:hypothetical protein CLOSBL3_20521 [Clostridiaceae bacterium BL-3]